ncbi:MAG: succinate dehydrogenase assembly factor 2 [Pseudomonadota bacterium]|jgi:antitoxin CptB
MDRNRLRWAARRGMLELDLLLETFLDAEYESLSSEQRAVLRRLLECEDQQLFAWLLGRATAPDAQLQAMVQRVREARRDGAP